MLLIMCVPQAVWLWIIHLCCHALDLSLNRVFVPVIIIIHLSALNLHVVETGDRCLSQSPHTLFAFEASFLNFQPLTPLQV